MSKPLTIGLIALLVAISSPAQTPPGTNEKKGGMLIDLTKIGLPPEETKLPEGELTPKQRFDRNKAKAEAGDSQAQYELALAYLQEPDRTVPVDYFEAYSWMVKASMKNHRMAQFHLGRLYENGWGIDKNLESALSWRRSAALHGCKQAQRWMGQTHLEAASGSTRFGNLIKQDPSSMVEAYAWLNLGSVIPFPPRLDPKTPGPEEVASDDPPLNLRDYNFEKNIPTSAARDRDIIARNPSFDKKMSEDAKARCVTLARESETHRAKNRPK
jgi:TPR repeat protein